MGASDFVEAMLARAEARYTRQTAWKRLGIGFSQVVARAAQLFQVTPQDVLAPGRQRHSNHPQCTRPAGGDSELRRI